MVRAHRAFFEAFYGEIKGDLFLCHKCDNPKCCNPRHMFVGTHQDNMDDMVSKGRLRRAKPQSAAPHIYRRNQKFRVEINKGGVRKQGTFATFCEAVAARKQFIGEFKSDLDGCRQ